MLQMDEIQKRLLSEVSGLHDVPTGAYNLRANGVSAGRQSTGSARAECQRPFTMTFMSGRIVMS